MTTYAVAIFCVIGLAAGQVLFKVSATALKESKSLLSCKTISAFLAAMCLYGVISFAWVWVLQKVELGRIYPLMALAFVLVPLGSYHVFGERFSSQYWYGVALIVLGIFIIAKA